MKYKKLSLEFCTYPILISTEKLVMTQNHDIISQLLTAGKFLGSYGHEPSSHQSLRRRQDERSKRWLTKRIGSTMTFISFKLDLMKRSRNRLMTPVSRRITASAIPYHISVIVVLMSIIILKLFPYLQFYFNIFLQFKRLFKGFIYFHSLFHFTSHSNDTMYLYRIYMFVLHCCCLSKRRIE